MTFFQPVDYENVTFVVTFETFLDILNILSSHGNHVHGGKGRKYVDDVYCGLDHVGLYFLCFKYYRKCNIFVAYRIEKMSQQMCYDVQ